ncbi:hypothetical protein J2S11_001447 [Bacillus horti]|uniref:ABC transporter permease n=2 Tax=Caldalkalibacillus horti TaxID=77523 RepID=A0ABT9VX32_9BACI|nr:hypothetical protein [Bacillus horti]
MSFQSTSLLSVVKRQYFYKLKAYIGVFGALMIVQIVGLLFSIGGGGMSGMSSGGISLSIGFYSGDIMILFTMIWAVMISITITTKAYRNSDFTFVTTRFSRNLANMAFLLTVGSVGGVTAMLSGVLLKSIAFYTLGSENVTIQHVSLVEFFIGIVATILYVILFCAIGYFIGTLVQLSKALVVFVPVLILGIITVRVDPRSGDTIMIYTSQFFGGETSLLIFLSKIICTVSVLFICSVLLSNRLEARK